MSLVHCIRDASNRFVKTGSEFKVTTRAQHTNIVNKDCLKANRTGATLAYQRNYDNRVISLGLHYGLPTTSPDLTALDFAIF
jgi:hypothetical protein